MLAVGAHPDDAELGCGASLAAASRRGLSVGILDLTRGERSTNGTPEERLREAGAAARVLGAAGRWNAGLPDRGLACDPASVRAVAAHLRALAPRLVLAPWWGDRHPDHRMAARLVAEASFESGLAPAERVAGEPPREPSERRRERTLLFYFINDTPPFSGLPPGIPALPPPALEGSLVVVPADEAAYDAKRRAIAAHRSQFGARPGDRPTTLNSGETTARVESRDAHFGSLVGAAFAEGFIRTGIAAVAGLEAFLR